jgi:hypothetical protein
VSRSAKVEALQTNPEACVHSIMHGAPNSVTHRQMSLLAKEVSGILEQAQRTSEQATRRSEETLLQPKLLRVEESKRSGLMAS